MKSITKRIGFELSMVVILALLIGTEYVLAATFGLTFKGLPYGMYQLNLMRAHPILTLLDGILCGYLFREGTYLMFDF